MRQIAAMNKPNAARVDGYAHGLKLSAQGRHAEAIEHFELALGQCPDDARVLFALGNTARALGLDQAAEEFFRRVLAQDPARLEALVSLANLLRARGQAQAAQMLLAPCLLRNPDAPELWLALGSALRDLGDVTGAAAHFREALTRRPDYAIALGNLADLLGDAGDRREALALYDRALRSEPDNAQARLNRAMLHLDGGNLTAGWRDYNARLKIAGKAPIAEHTLSKWNGTFTGQTRLLVTTEQGVGDQIMFASLIPELAARAAASDASIILECDPRLVPLFARSFRRVHVHAADLETKGGVTRARYGWLKAAGGANAAVEQGSLPRLLRTSLESFPSPHSFLTPDALETARWGGFLAGAGRGPFIGLCWRSSKMGGERGLQYAPRAAWAAFVAQLPGTLLSLQYDATSDEVEELARLSGRTILVPPGLDQKHELDRTLALVSSLDAIVSAPTAVSWLAAGAGVDTYKVLYNSSWTSFGQTFEPFAPSCLCMTPEMPGDWTRTFAKTLSSIKERL